MKKLFYTAIAGLLFMGCTVDNDELNFSEDQILTADLTVECVPAIYEINDSGNLIGKLTVNTIDETTSNVIITAEEGYSIRSIKSAYAASIVEIPQNNSGIQSNQLGLTNYPDVIQTTQQVTGYNSFAFAASVEFVNSKGRKTELWVGDHTIGSKATPYFTYQTCILEDPCAYLSAGKSKSTTISRDFVLSNLRYSWQVEQYLLDMLDEGVPVDGTFNPSISKLIESYRENMFQTFVTTYMVTEGGCSSSVELSITVGAYHDYQL